MSRTPSSPPPKPVPLPASAGATLPLQPLVQPVAPPIPASPSEGLMLWEAVTAASENFGPLRKDKENTYLKSKYLSPAALDEALREPLLQYSVIWYSRIMFDSGTGNWFVRTYLQFVDGSEADHSDFPITDPTNHQRVGICVTYGIRYNLMALLRIVPLDDDDGNVDGYTVDAISKRVAPPQVMPAMPATPAQNLYAQQQFPPPQAAWPPNGQGPAPQGGWPQAMYQGHPGQQVGPFINPVQPLPTLQ
jgi:hypothetical protein